MNILLTSSARRIDFVGFFRDALKDAGMNGNIIVADPEDNAPSLQAGDISYVIPHQTDPRYVEAIIYICKKHDVSCLVPLNDWEVPKLSAHKKELEILGVAMYVPDHDIAEKVRDKGKYRELLEPFQVKAPHSYLNIEDAQKALNNNQVSLPLIIKPRNGSASVGVEIAHNLEDLKIGYEQVVQEIKETPLDDDSSKDAHDNIIIQKVIEGDKFSVDMFNDLNGNFLTSLIRKQLDMRGGDIDRCITENPPELTEIAKRMGENLGHAGYLNADVYYDGSDYYVIDINPRFGGGYAFSHKAGANIPASIIALTSGREVNKDWLTQQANLELARHDIVIPIDKNKEKYVI